jgi:uncharacterized protein involved in exopolysaccharide biosynthesis
MQTASPDDIDITAIWRALRSSLPKVVVLALIAGITAYAILSVYPPLYTSDAQIQVVPPERSETGGSNASIEAVAGRLDKEAINTHVRALKSPDLAAEIIAAEGLANKPEFNSTLRPQTFIERIKSFFLGESKESEQDRVMKAYFDRLDVYSPKESRVIDISFSSEDPDLAAAVANRIASSYRSLLATRSVAGTDELQKALEPRIEKLTQEVSQADAAVEDFRAQANIYRGGPNDTGLSQQRLTEFTAELSRVQAARNEAESRAHSVRDMVQAGNAEALPDVQKSPLIQNLVQQRVRVERQLSELSATLLPAHPRMRQLRADLAGLERQIKSEVHKVVEGIEKGASAAVLREKAVQESIDNMKSQVAGSGGDQVKLRQLEAVAKSKRAELERLQARYEANRARADSRAVPIDAEIISKARPSSVPSFPRKLPYSALVAMAVLLFGIAIVVTRALFNAARSPGQIDASAWAQPRPLLAGTAASSHTPVLGFDRGSVADANSVQTVQSVASLARQLLIRPPDVGGFRTLITGTTDEIDAGADAAELAKFLTDAGSDVMVVDWSLDGHGLAEALHATAIPGMTELLRGKAKFEDVVGRLPGSSAHLIACGAAPGDLGAILDPDHINLALDALDTAYDHIIVVGRNADARALFEAIQGRFDAGVVVAEGRSRGARSADAEGTFLGFEVTDIELFRLEHPMSTKLAEERLARLTARSSGASDAPRSSTGVPPSAA